MNIPLPLKLSDALVKLINKNSLKKKRKIATTFKPKRLLVLLFWCSVLNNCQSFVKRCHCRKIETSLCKAKLWFKKKKKVFKLTHLSANSKHEAYWRFLKPKPTQIPQSAYCFFYQLAPPAERRSADAATRAALSCSADQGDSPFAGVNLLSLRALLTFNVAAPTHLALAGSGHLPALSVVTSPAANGVAVFVLVALTGRCARRILAGSAETRRVLYVEQVHSAGDLVVQAR